MNEHEGDDDDGADPADWWKPQWEPTPGPDGRVDVPRSVLKNPSPREQAIIIQLYREGRVRIVKGNGGED